MLISLQLQESERALVFDNLEMTSMKQDKISAKPLPVCMIKCIRKREIAFPHPAFL